jgi:hypothetical protein
MRKFWLDRWEDESSVSGTGIVAEGIIFSDGVAVLRWLTAGGSTAVYDDIKSVERIHGHDGKTKVVYSIRKGGMGK